MTPANSATLSRFIHLQLQHQFIDYGATQWIGTWKFMDCACPNMSRAPSLAASPIYNTFWIDPLTTPLFAV